MCHRLVSPLTSPSDRLAISITAPLLLRQRKLLRNVLLTHGGLDQLLDFLEGRGLEGGEPRAQVDEALEGNTPKELGDEGAKTGASDEEPGDSLWQGGCRGEVVQAVLALSHLALHLGLQPPPLLHPGEEVCSAPTWRHSSDLLLLLDSGEQVGASRSALAAASPVFAAMLEGGFQEAGRGEVALPQVSAPALACLLHHLYGCPAPCPASRALGVATMLEILGLADRFLLPELHEAVTACLLARCLEAPAELATVYRMALQGGHQVQGATTTLSRAAVTLSLVGEVEAGARAALVTSITASDLRGDYIDDVANLLRGKLLDKP